MDSSTIIILAIILFILILLNNITVIVNHNDSQAPQGNCSQTAFGCCPDGVNSRVNYYGTNCPGYRPGPGYPLHPEPAPPKQIGGCAGTRYGCCANNSTSKVDINGSNCLGAK
jgi:hypothetical protein